MILGQLPLRANLITRRGRSRWLPRYRCHRQDPCRFCFSVKIGFSHPNPPFLSLREPSRALARLRRRSIPVVASVHTPKFLIPHGSGTLFHFLSRCCFQPCFHSHRPWITREKKRASRKSSPSGRLLTSNGTSLCR